jgi:hypothetical protein
MRSRKGRRKAPVLFKSPVIATQSRSIPFMTRLQLFVRSGGRCEFDGCNKFLLRHSLTRMDGNFSQMAHIVAFKPAGPRGRKTRSWKNAHAHENLMLLCHECHKLIDTHPDRYTTRTLRLFKRQHEERIHQLTSTAPDRQTTVVILKGMIGTQAVEISPSEIQAAIAPRYPDADPLIIDLTGIPDTGDESFWKAATQAIDDKCDRLYSTRFDGSTPRHLSVFALAPIPLLVHLGSRLSSKIPLDLHQRHRGSEDWKWKTTGDTVNYVFGKTRDGSDKLKVALAVSLSGTVPAESLMPHVGSDCTVYTITLDGITPNPGFLRQRRDLIAFEQVYRQLLAVILRDHGIVEELHVFPAVPAPIAIILGREPLPKVHPTLIIYDYSKSKGGFTQTIRSVS